MTPAVGETIFLQVTADSGAFAGERLITFDAQDGPISGFIRADQVRVRNGKNFIEAKVLKVSKDCIAIKLHGSFFTTTGLAHIDKDTPFLTAA